MSINHFLAHVLHPWHTGIVATKKSKKGFSFNRRLQLIIFAVALVVIGVVGYYAVTVYEETEAEQLGIVICNAEKCEKSVHIHADIHASVCGEKIDFPKNEGSVVEQHTHAEQDYLHLHIKFEVDPVTHEPIDRAPHELANFFKNVKIPFSSNPATLGEYTVGQTCPNGKILAQEDLKMSVNGVETTEFEQYMWKDGDDIRLTFE